MLKNLIRKLLFIKDYLLWFFYKLMKVIKINKNKIVVVNYYGKGYGDSSKYIVEKLANNNLIEIYWLVQKNTEQSREFPENVKVVNYNSIIGHYHLATAKIWLDNCRKPWYVTKRKGQFYIQLWHGSPALKKIEADAESKLNKPYLKNAKSDSKKIDLFISNCKWLTDKIPDTFWYKGQISELGLPRNDIFFENINFEKKVNLYFEIDKKVKTVLYAPTFRNSSDLTVYDIDFMKLIKLLEEKTGEEWQVLIRLHPNISNKSDIIKYNKNVLNASKYADLQELISYSDLLITDYSSVMFDFALTRKPIFLYCNDFDEYKEERDVYFELEDLPFLLSFDLEGLYYNIRNFNMNDYNQNLTHFLNTIGMNLDGKSAEKIIKIIEKEINKHN